MGKQQDHVVSGLSSILQDFDTALSHHERDALTAAISALTVDEDFVRRVLAALIRERGTYEGEVPITEDDIRAALQAAIQGA